MQDGVHINGMENYWSLFKQCIYGTWTHPSEAHLHRYLTQQEYRYNTKAEKDDYRFVQALTQVTGKRITHQTNTAARAFSERRGFTLIGLGISPPPESEPDAEYHWSPAE